MRAALSRRPEGPRTPHQLEAQRLLGLLAGMGVVGPQQSYASGQIIYEEGACGEALYLLLSGVARLSRKGPDETQTTSRLAGSWETFGSTCFSHGLTGRARRSNRAQAKTDCEVVKIPGLFLQRAMRKSPQAALTLMTIEEVRLAEHEELLGCLLPYETVARLAALLLMLEREFGEGTSKFPYPAKIGVRLTHGELSDMVSCTRKSVTWAMKRLRKERAIAVKKRGFITILAPRKLEEISRESGRGYLISSQESCELGKSA